MQQNPLDVYGFKLVSFLFSYGPLEPMVINFMCNFYLQSATPLPHDLMSKGSMQLNYSALVFYAMVMFRFVNYPLI